MVVNQATRNTIKSYESITTTKTNCQPLRQSIGLSILNCKTLWESAIIKRRNPEFKAVGQEKRKRKKNELFDRRRAGNSATAETINQRKRKIIDRHPRPAAQIENSRLILRSCRTRSRLG